MVFFSWRWCREDSINHCFKSDPEKYDIDILEMEHFDKGYESVPKHVRILKSLQDYRQTRWLRAFLWRMRIYFPRLARRLLVKDDYDVEVSFTIMNPPLLFSKRREVKKISWIHGSIEELLKDSSKRESHRSQLDAANTIVGISKRPAILSRKFIQIILLNYRQSTMDMIFRLF